MSVLQSPGQDVHSSALLRQVFVANPNKTQPIVDILAGNKEKLLKYLSDFHTDKSALPWIGRQSNL